MSNRPPAFVGSSNEGRNMGAPPSLIGNWPNNNGTIGAGKKRKTSKGEGLLLGKN